MKDDAWILWAFGALGALMLILVVAAAATGPRCVRGHQYAVLVPRHEEVRHVGRVRVKHQVPAHFETRWACDQWEQKH